MSGPKYTVPQLYALAQLEGDPATQAQHDAWLKVCNAVEEHAQTLSDAAADLAVVWPPESSETAQAFAKFVTDFLNAMTVTAQATANTARALVGIDGAISDAVASLGDYQAKWDRNAAIAHKIRTDSVLDSIGDIFSTADDLDPNWQAKLNTQVYQQVIAKLDREVAETLGVMEVPPIYVAKLSFVRPGDTGGDGSGGGSGEGRVTGAALGAGIALQAGAGIPALSPPPTVTDAGVVVPAGSGGGAALSGTALPGTSTSTLPAGGGGGASAPMVGKVLAPGIGPSGGAGLAPPTAPGGSGGVVSQRTPGGLGSRGAVPGTASGAVLREPGPGGRTGAAAGSAGGTAGSTGGTAGRGVGRVIGGPGERAGGVARADTGGRYGSQRRRESGRCGASTRMIRGGWRRCAGGDHTAGRAAGARPGAGRDRDRPLRPVVAARWPRWRRC